MSDRELQNLRACIDELNVEILALIQERAEVVLQIARLKETMDKDGFDPRREEEMLRELIRPGSGPFSPAEVEAIFRSIFRASLALQERVREGVAATASTSPR